MTNHTISETYLQITNGVAAFTIECAICGDHTLRTEAATGPCNASGELTLICNRHLRDGRQLIGPLADYMVEERQRFKRRAIFINTEGVVPDAWFLH